MKETIDSIHISANMKAFRNANLDVVQDDQGSGGGQRHCLVSSAKTLGITYPLIAETVR
jgi:hypothetical protein